MDEIGQKQKQEKKALQQRAGREADLQGFTLVLTDMKERKSPLRTLLTFCFSASTLRYILASKQSISKIMYLKIGLFLISLSVKIENL